MYAWRLQVQILLKAAHLFFGDCFECFHLLCLAFLHVFEHTHVEVHGMYTHNNGCICCACTECGIA